jgi:membrane associated rhomboid family serine protease
MFIAIPVGMNYQTERLPLVTFSLIGLNTLIWFVTTICFFSTDGTSDAWVADHLWLVPAALTWHACLTSMFVHAGIFHLLGNMIFLFLFGSCVEDIIGRWTFAAFYLVGGLIAEIFYIAMSPEHFQSTIPMGGASGAISACMGMYLLLRAGAEIEFKYLFWFFLIYMRAGSFEIPAWVAITFWFAKDLLMASLNLLAHTHGLGGGVAFGAHVGGLLGGLGLVAAWQRIRKPPEPEPIEPRVLIDTSRLVAAARARTPLATASETPTIFLHDGQQQTGPFTLTAVQTMLREGQIGRDASYWSEGMADWQSIVDLAGQPFE